MYDGISVVSGTERQIHAAFGIEGMIIPLSKAKNLEQISNDLDRTHFLSQSPGDFETFAQLWVNFNSPSYAQGDMMGSPVLFCIQGFMNECYQGKSLEDYQAFSRHRSNFGYINDLGEASGVGYVTLRDPNDPTFYYWFISIMHDATGSSEERTIHLISNLPKRDHKPIYHAEKCPELKPQKIRNRKALLAFLKNHAYSAQVYSFFEKLLNKDCTLKGEGEELGSHNFLSQENIKTQSAKKAKEIIWRKLDEARDQVDQDVPENKEFSVLGISDLRQSVYDLHQHGLDVSKKDAIKGQKIIDFSKELNTQAKKIAKSNTEEELLEHKKVFEILLGQPKKEKGEHAIFWHRGKLKVLLANIGFAFGTLGIGILFIAGKLIYSGIKEKRFLPFWGKTKSEEFSDKAKTQTDKLAFKAKKN